MGKFDGVSDEELLARLQGWRDSHRGLSDGEI